MDLFNAAIRLSIIEYETLNNMKHQSTQTEPVSFIALLAKRGLKRWEESCEVMRYSLADLQFQSIGLLRTYAKALYTSGKEHTGSALQFMMHVASLQSSLRSKGKILAQKDKQNEIDDIILIADMECSLNKT